MSENHNYLFKIAKHEHEFQQIHRLNYQTFVKEIPQHRQNQEEMLIDPYNSENTYIICLKDNQVVGMIAVRDKRPFSLDKKIGPVEQSLPVKAESICEIRLLSVKKEYRNGRIFLGIAQFLARYCLKKCYDVGVISGTVRQLKLYEQMGFQPFAELVGSGDAIYQPMLMTKETFDQSIAGRIIKPTVNFLPGPIQISDDVISSLMVEANSHRSKPFIEKMKHTKKMLCEIANSSYVEILLGSGTLANDVIAGQLFLLNKKGLILRNGEFGARLQEHAERMNLDFDCLEMEWGQAFTKEDILAKISEDTAWIWAVHSETSTGMLNDLAMLKQIAEEKNIKLCLDCISSIGAVPIDLNRVYLASGVSGKALGAFTGLSLVFHQQPVHPSKKLPKYIDLGMYSKHESIPFSHSSNLLEALLTSLQSNPTERYQKINTVYNTIRAAIEEVGLELVTPKSQSSPAILTIKIPSEISSVDIGEMLSYQGYQLHYESSYLIERNWMQIATVGDIQPAEIEKMLDLFCRIFESEKTAVLQS